MKEIVERLIELNRSISTMESCTGGYIVNAITNIPGASNILKYSCVTYSNEYKIKMGVDKRIIDKYSVYSMEVAKDMSLKISQYANSNYGIGITGKLLRADQNNDVGQDNEVYVSIYDKDNSLFFTSKISVYLDSREKNKELILKEVINLLKKALKR